MERLQGKSISRGFAAGTAVVLEPGAEAVPRRSISPPGITAEILRFEAAVAQSERDLLEVRRRVRDELGKSHSGIFETHLAILHDPAMFEGVKSRIAADLISAEEALDMEVAEVCDRIALVGDAFLRERQQDVRDVGRRVLGHLRGSPMVSADSLGGQSVLVARELLPSDTLNVDREHLAAIITENCGETSHAAILARALGVPAVTGIDRLLQHVRPGMEVLVNGETGEVVVSPTPDQLSVFSRQLRHWDEAREEGFAAEGLPCSTVDGAVISLHANISRPEEATHVHDHHLDGVGLLRTEFLFLDATEPPSIEYQVQVYRTILDTAHGKPVVIRTLDMAADKHPRFLATRFDHRFLSFRGLRFSLKEKSLFHEQAAAIAKTAHFGNVGLLLPMVVDPQDVAQAIDIITELSVDVGLEKRPPVGVMIETPAAVMLLDRLIEMVDFVSIGTNDLTQYLLAAERSAIDIDEDYCILHPAVMRSVRHIVNQSSEAQKPLSVCGEAAGDPYSACLLAGLGVRRLSMSPVRAARVRQTLRGCSIKRLEQIASDALMCSTTGEVRKLLRESLPAIQGGTTESIKSGDRAVSATGSFTIT